MASFQWDLRSTAYPYPKNPELTCYREHALLGDVDNVVRDWFHAPHDDKSYHPFYNIVVECCFGALMNLGGTYIEDKHVEWILDAFRRCDPDGTDINRPSEIALLKYLLLEKYSFKAWR